jgi:uncharacterized GH25 family protein
MHLFCFKRTRQIVIGSMVFLLLFTTAAPALIMVGKGNAPTHDAGWPAGALELANLKTRIGWYEGPPFGGGQWCFMYRGEIADLNAALKAFGAIRAPSLQLFVHDGPGENQFLADPKTPKADTHYDWSFTVWVPANWHRLFNDPRTTFMADSPNFHKPVDPPRFDIYVSPKIDWSKVTVPQGVEVIDQRAPAGGAKAGGASIKGDVFDMATGKPIANAEIRMEIYKTPENTYTKAAAGTGDKDGRFELANIPTGHARIIAAAPGYAPRMIGYEEFKDGESRKFTVELSKGVKLSGLVTDGNGTPLAGIVVRTSNNMGIDGRGYSLPEAPQTKTDDTGHFTINDLPTGYSQMWAYAKGFYQQESLKLHPIPTETPLTIQMVATGVIKGTVVDAKGKPVRDGTINVSVPGGDQIGKWGGSMNIKSDGTFQFDNVPPGEYVISTVPQLPGIKPDPNAQHVTLGSGKILEVTVAKTR